GKKAARKYLKQFKKDFLDDNEYNEVSTNNFTAELAEDIYEFDAATHDAWIVQCPKGMNPNALEGKRIKMPGRRYVGDIQVRATHYEEPISQAIGYVNSKGKYALRRLPLVGNMIISKRLNMEQPNTDEQVDTYPEVVKPQKFTLPVRHPLFGRDYKERIEVSKRVAKKLRQADKKNTETCANLRKTNNFYKIRNKLLATTQTLEEKEFDVRQSVLTGLAPKFMAKGAQLNYLNGSNDDEVVEVIEIDDKDEALSKPSKKRKANGKADAQSIVA
ncbi:CG11076, partial [Drosophila busckii]